MNIYKMIANVSFFCFFCTTSSFAMMEGDADPEAKGEAKQGEEIADIANLLVQGRDLAKAAQAHLALLKLINEIQGSEESYYKAIKDDEEPILQKIETIDAGKIIYFKQAFIAAISLSEKLQKDLVSLLNPINYLLIKVKNLGVNDLENKEIILNELSDENVQNTIFKVVLNFEGTVSNFIKSFTGVYPILKQMSDESIKYEALRDKYGILALPAQRAMRYTLLGSALKELVQKAGLNELGMQLFSQGVDKLRNRVLEAQDKYTILGIENSFNADPNTFAQLDDTGNSALHLAFKYHGDKEFIARLINKIKAKEKETHISRFGRFIWNPKTYYSKFYSPNKANKTPWDIAADMKYDPAIIEELKASFDL